MRFSRLDIEALLNLAEKKGQVIEETTFDSLVWDAADAEEPNENNLVQASSVVMKNAENEGI